MSMETDIDQPSWPDILRAVQDQLAARIHTSLPGIVKSYDTPTQTATVQLAVQLDGVSVPPLHDVPVCWPGGAAGFFHAPLAAGDTVMVLFAEDDFSKWFDSGSVSAPALLQRHGLHAVAIPGLRRAAAPLAVTAGHATIGVASELRLGSDTAANFVALANLVDDRFTALANAFSAWVTVPNDGGAALKTLLTTLAGTGWPASVAATKVKAT